MRFEGFVGRDVYPDLLKICSLGLVCLSPQNQTPVVPGKILGYMAAGLPVVAFLQSQSDGHAIVQSANVVSPLIPLIWSMCGGFPGNAKASRDV